MRVSRFFLTPKAFTLAELLIALAILGVIATFTIPKILTAQADQKKQAVVKETVAALEGLFYNYALESEVMGESACRARINAIKVCDDSLAEGCWTADMAATSESGEIGFVLANGAYITGVCANTNDWDSFVMDWNGPEPPNVFGEDTYALQYCIDPDGCSTGGKFGLMRKNIDYVRAYEGG